MFIAFSLTSTHLKAERAAGNRPWSQNRAGINDNTVTLIKSGPAQKEEPGLKVIYKVACKGSSRTDYSSLNKAP